MDAQNLGFPPVPNQVLNIFPHAWMKKQTRVYCIKCINVAPPPSSVIGWGEFCLVLVKWCYFYVIVSNWTWQSTRIPMSSTHSTCMTRCAYAQAWFHRSTLLHVESSLADCKICLFVDADEQEFLGAISVGKVYVLLLFMPSDVSRSGLYILPLSVFFSTIRRTEAKLAQRRPGKSI